MSTLRRCLTKVWGSAGDSFPGTFFWLPPYNTLLWEKTANQGAEFSAEFSLSDVRWIKSQPAPGEICSPLKRSNKSLALHEGEDMWTAACHTRALYESQDVTIIMVKLCKLLFFFWQTQDIVKLCAQRIKSKWPSAITTQNVADYLYSWLGFTTVSVTLDQVDA